MKSLCFIILIAALLVSCEKTLFQKENNDPRTVFDSFWYELDRNYSFFDKTNLNWDSVYTSNHSKITSNTSDEELYQMFSGILDLLGDAHSNIYTPYGIGGNTDYFDKYPVNQMNLNESNVETLQVFNKVYEYGKLKAANLGYIRIKTFEGTPENFEGIDTIISQLQATKALIIDIRSNRGGYISNSEIVASRLVNESKTAFRYRTRNGSAHTGFSLWTNAVISPRGEIQYTNPVAILTNRQTFSAAEWFVLFVKVMPNVTIIGDTTGGGSAKTILRELSNGWTLRTSNTQTLMSNGCDFQFTGLFPDIPIWISPEDYNREVDTILEKAILLLNNK
jgi:hypothetical protein